MTRAAPELGNPVQDGMATDWRLRAACRGTDVNLWFAPPNVPSASPMEQQRVADAKAICAECPVTAECLDYAQDGSAGAYGVWGGLTPYERRDRHRRDIRRRKYLKTKARSRSTA